MEICVEVDVLVEVVNLRDVGCQWRCSNTVIRFVTDNPNLSGHSAPLLTPFANAATATWTVLHLCGAPWLEEDWAGLSTSVMETRTKEPAISCALMSQSNISASKRPAPRNDGIRNRVLFTLGVLLTELCLNTTVSI